MFITSVCLQVDGWSTDRRIDKAEHAPSRDLNEEYKESLRSRCRINSHFLSVCPFALAPEKSILAHINLALLALLALDTCPPGGHPRRKSWNRRRVSKPSSKRRRGTAGARTHYFSRSMMRRWPLG
eukprot:1195205-Prorocentrum_minimum.AAC.3